MSESAHSERRRHTRIRYEAPATVAAADHKLAASVKDISERGLFCFTDANIEIGSAVDVIIMLPKEAGLPVSGMVCCTGHVVRSTVSSGQFGLAVEIDNISPAPYA